MKTKRICTRCVLPESPPDIRLDAAGLCSVCAAKGGAEDAQSPAPLLESDFVKLLRKSRGKGEYDCLVMASGGKDSTAALYLMARRYKASVLAFTFDHGFESEEALANVRRAVAALGVDSLYFRSAHMRPLFAKVVSTGSKAVICHICSIWYMGLALRTAERFGIPVLIAGWTRAQSARGRGLDGPEFASMSRATRDFLALHARGDPRYKDLPGSMEEVLSRAAKRHPCAILSPHWFLPGDSSSYIPLIEKELGWRRIERSYPAQSTNCALNFLSVDRCLRDYGYTHYHVEMSKLIREGLMTREEALRLLEPDYSPELLQRILRDLQAPLDGPVHD
ncbi:MAG: 7-cyano-7-deazaguanine synthase [Elusimicrobiota bacterium]